MKRKLLVLAERIAAASLFALCFGASAQFIDERPGKENDAAKAAVIQGGQLTVPAAVATPVVITAPAPVVAPAPAPPPVVFDVRDTDMTIREVLIRWSTSSGWTHNPSHWTLARDLPISGTADASLFGAEYKEATRRLLSSTELTDMPLQPCFYTNKILRVVPKSELCDKTVINN